MSHRTTTLTNNVPVLRALQRQGLQLGLCSNLAKPYAPPVLSLLPFELDAYAWSFEVGAVKPYHRIYSTVWQSLALSPGEVLMVGDTYEADCLGPRRVGMHAIHLARNLASPAPCFLRSLCELPAYLALQAPPSVPQYPSSPSWILGHGSCISFLRLLTSSAISPKMHSMMVASAADSLGERPPSGDSPNNQTL